MNNVWTDKSVVKFIREQNNIDPILAMREKVRGFVLDAFNVGWEGPPFDPIKLAGLLGITVIPNENLRDAKIIPLPKNKFRIEYNPNRKLARINFSIAHEIGHTLFSDCSATERNRDNEENYSKELEFLCDIAASEILLPYAEFTSDANLMPLNLDSLMSLSDKYKASLTSVFLRFCEVINKSCAIIISSFDSDNKGDLIVDYYKRSLSNKLNISKGYKIPKNSKALECTNPGWTAYGKEKWEIFNNIPHNISCIGLAQIKKSPSQRVGILIVPDEYEDEPEKRMYQVFGDATIPRGTGNKIIVQIVNTYGAVGAGFGKVLKKKYPLSYHSIKEWKDDGKDFCLGHTKILQVEKDLYIFQIIAQKGLYPKNNETILNYNALRKGLQELSIVAKNLDASLHMPLIGAGQAKGNWKIIEGMIYDELILNSVGVIIYLLPGNRISTNQNTNLTLFKEESLYEQQ